MTVGHNVIRVLATDADQPNTPNSNIAYSITSGNTGNAFRILPNGQIEISNTLDFETTPSYSLTVVGRDGGSPATSSTATVSVAVVNVNENPPTLTGDQSVNISESTPVASIIAVFAAQDQDQMAITLSIASGNNEGKFAINNTGVITLSASLDYEAATSYTLTIRASDGQHFTNSTLTVQVLDENEFSPVFSQPFTYMLLEEEAAGTQVGTVEATDGDRDAQITYFFVGQNQAYEKFSLHPTSGAITTSAVLDREALTQVFVPPSSQVTLQIAATDNGSPSRQSLRDYTITLVDINDNSPIFSDSMYSNQLRENLPAGQEVFSVSATDSDLGTNSQITYSFTLANNQGSSNPFQIDQATGATTTTAPLDCELQPFYLFSITATDAGSPQRSSTVTGNLTLIDENDNSPRFTQTMYNLTVREDVPAGILDTFTATDLDKGINGEIEYTIIQDQSLGVVFAIDINTGALTNINLFNFENSSQETLTVIATDKGLPQRSASTTVVINVINVDEQRPQFQTASCEATVSEDVATGTVVSTCSATDSDSISAEGDIRVTYSLTNPYFEVDPLNGTIETKTSLDRETNSVVRLTLIATDSSNLTSTRSFNVFITDINDNSPIFTSNPATIQVSEDLPHNRAVAEYRATDADEGSNAIIEFSLAPSNVPFTLNSSSGSLSLTGPIDYESVQSYSVTVTASNPGTSRAVTTTSTIQILNVNDNTPVISGEPYRVTVIENSPIGTLVTTINATDGDLGIHGEIRYTIISGNINLAFNLNSGNGALTINSSIDRESISSFSLVVRVRDRGTPQTTEDQTTITVTVFDVNDNAPVFRPNSYSVQLREDLTVGHNVIRVLATDADQPNTPNSNIAYSITSGNTGNAFRILPNGQIEISNTLDFETTPSYSLTVVGRDGGSPAMSSTATVSVAVVNVNENPPTLTGDQSVNISESTHVASIIAVFAAQDQDQMAITLSIASGNNEGKFAINNTGVITLSASLDYEAATSYTLTIRASDGQHFTNSTLTVQVLDENEFSPVFSQPFTYMLLEEEATGTQVGTVEATDGDRDAQITYFFVGQNQAYEKFSLHPTSGAITTSAVLDREALTQVFVPPSSQVTLQIAATDNGSPSRQSLRDYTITLVDINDNSPIFSDSMYSNQLRENLPAGQEVFSVSATDSDLGTNSQITYSFTLANNQGSSNPFQIDQATGATTTTAPLDCELQPFYLFSITATDAGSPQRSSTVTGNLTLIDENDNSPRFTQTMYNLTVREDVPAGILDTFTATDLDKGINGEIEYTIIQDQSLGVVFAIDINTGALTNINLFNFENSSQETLTVIATDKGLPQRSASTTVVINVINVDEQRPQFQTASCEATVSEDVATGTVVSTCSATDSDSISAEGDIRVTYSLTNPYFEVDPLNGTIETKTSLDRETNSVVRLTLIATDSSNLTSTRSFNVFITDINDNAPQFRSTVYRHEFTDASIEQQTTEILTVEATDPDSGDNGTVSYLINGTHQISDTETHVEVVAQDGGTPPQTSTVNVIVTFQSPCQLQTYSITTNDGQLSAHLLCAVTISPATPFSLTLGQSGALSCHIIHNSPVEYQFLHNSTALTNLAVVIQNSTQEFNLTEITYGHSGEYACRAISLAGNLQAPASVASVQGN